MQNIETIAVSNSCMSVPGSNNSAATAEHTEKII